MRKTEMGPKFFHGFDYHLRWGVLLNAKIAAEFSQPQTFLLQYYLVIAGGIGLFLIIIDVLAQYVIKWILEDGKVSDIEQKILTSLKVAGFVLAFVQLAALIAGSVLIYANFPNVTYDRPSECDNSKRMAVIPQAGNLVYCDYAMFMFSFCLVTMTWSCILLGVICFAYIFHGLKVLSEK